MIMPSVSSLRQAKPGCPHDHGPIAHLLETELFGINPSLAVGQGASAKTSRYFLLECGGRQQVTGELFNGELVERHVVVEGLNHPLTPVLGVWSRVVFFVTIAV